MNSYCKIFCSTAAAFKHLSAVQIGDDGCLGSPFQIWEREELCTVETPFLARFPEETAFFLLIKDEKGRLREGAAPNKCILTPCQPLTAPASAAAGLLVQEGIAERCKQGKQGQTGEAGTSRTGRTSTGRHKQGRAGAVVA